LLQAEEEISYEKIQNEFVEIPWIYEFDGSIPKANVDEVLKVPGIKLK
jgi:hypothetical protein